MYLAGLKCGDFVPIREISSGTGISPSFLTKILRVLNENGFIESSRGPNGGVMLRRHPKSITLKDIVVALDGPGLFENCVVGLPGCGQEKPCPLHDQWSVTRRCITDTFSTTSLAELVHHRSGKNASLQQSSAEMISAMLAPILQTK